MQNRETKTKKYLIDALFLLAGCAAGAFGSVAIMVPNGLSSGGLMGIARILQAIIPGLHYPTAFAILTLLTFLVVGMILGKKEMKKLALLAVLFPLITSLAEHIDFHLLEEPDIFLAAIYAGACSGLCSGLILARGYSLCASDAIAKMLRKKVFKSASVSKILLIVDGVVIITSGFFYGTNVALYALISQIVSTKVIDIIIFGLASRIVEVKIITENPDAITEYILHTMNRGVSISTVTGAYTMTQRKQLLTYCSPRESVLIRQHVAKMDERAFVAVIKVDTVWGRGAGFSDLLKGDGDGNR